MIVLLTEEGQKNRKVVKIVGWESSGFMQVVLGNIGQQYLI